MNLIDYLIGSKMTDLIVTGSAGFLGKHVTRRLDKLGVDYYPVWSNAYNLTSLDDIKALFTHTGVPQAVLHMAAHVGGIQYNLANPAKLFYDNVMMNTQLIDESAKRGVKRFVFISSVCAYPAFPPFPTKEIHLFENSPEESNLTYGLSKRMAFAQLQAYKEQWGMEFDYLLLSNLYGPGDSFSDEKSHVVAALIKKFCADTPTIEIWGDGSQSRDLLYVEDAADAIISCFTGKATNEAINISTNRSLTVAAIVEQLINLSETNSEIVYNTQRPTGQARRCYDNAKAKSLIGWQPETPFSEGLKKTVEWYLCNS